MYHYWPKKWNAINLVQNSFSNTWQTTYMPGNCWRRNSKMKKIILTKFSRKKKTRKRSFINWAVIFLYYTKNYTLSRTISCLQDIVQLLHEDFCSLILATFSDALLVYWTYFLEVPLGNHRKPVLAKSIKIFSHIFIK